MAKIVDYLPEERSLIIDEGPEEEEMRYVGPHYAVGLGAGAFVGHVPVDEGEEEADEKSDLEDVDDQDSRMQEEEEDNVGDDEEGDKNMETEEDQDIPCANWDEISEPSFGEEEAAAPQTQEQQDVIRLLRVHLQVRCF